MNEAYMYKAALYCAECGEKIRAELTAAGKAPADPDDESSYDSDDFPKGPFPDGGGEADTAQHCDGCGEFLENPLTDEGVEDVRESIERALIKGDEDSVALIEWRPRYGIDPEDPAAIRLGRMTKDFRATLDERGKRTGELPKYTSVGSYPLYYATNKNELVCPACANDAGTGLDAFDGAKINACAVNWEDPDLWCDCGERIESAYAEDKVKP